MKKYAIFVTMILALVIFTSGCTDTQNQNTKTYSANGISFNYPDSWVPASTSVSNAVVSFGDPKSVNASTGNVNTLLIVQKVAMPSNMTLKQAFDSNFAKVAAQNPSYQLIDNTTTTVDGTTAYINTHKINANGVQKEEKAVWIEKNGNIYVILMGTIPDAFNNQQANFDAVIKSFHVM